MGQEDGNAAEKQAKEADCGDPVGDADGQRMARRIRNIQVPDGQFSQLCGLSHTAGMVAHTASPNNRKPAELRGLASG
jgi:hypothetical protein